MVVVRIKDMDNDKHSGKASTSHTNMNNMLSYSSRIIKDKKHFQRTPSIRRREKYEFDFKNPIDCHPLPKVLGKRKDNTLIPKIYQLMKQNSIERINEQINGQVLNSVIEHPTKPESEEIGKAPQEFDRVINIDDNKANKPAEEPKSFTVLVSEFFSDINLDFKDVEVYKKFSDCLKELVENINTEYDRSEFVSPSLIKVISDANSKRMKLNDLQKSVDDDIKNIRNVINDKICTLSSRENIAVDAEVHKEQSYPQTLKESGSKDNFESKREDANANYVSKEDTKTEKSNLSFEDITEDATAKETNGEKCYDNREFCSHALFEEIKRDKTDPSQYLIKSVIDVHSDVGQIKTLKTCRHCFRESLIEGNCNGTEVKKQDVKMEDVYSKSDNEEKNHLCSESGTEEKEGKEKYGVTESNTNEVAIEEISQYPKESSMHDKSQNRKTQNDENHIQHSTATISEVQLKSKMIEELVQKNVEDCNCKNNTKSLEAADQKKSLNLNDNSLPLSSDDSNQIENKKLVVKEVAKIYESLSGMEINKISLGFNNHSGYQTLGKATSVPEVSCYKSEDEFYKSACPEIFDQSKIIGKMDANTAIPSVQQELSKKMEPKYRSEPDIRKINVERKKTENELQTLASQKIVQNLLVNFKREEIKFRIRNLITVLLDKLSEMRKSQYLKMLASVDMNHNYFASGFWKDEVLRSNPFLHLAEFYDGRDFIAHLNIFEKPHLKALKPARRWSKYNSLNSSESKRRTKSENQKEEVRVEDKNVKIEGTEIVPLKHLLHEDRLKTDIELTLLSQRRIVKNFLKNRFRSELDIKYGEMINELKHYLEIVKLPKLKRVHH